MDDMTSIFHVGDRVKVISREPGYSNAVGLEGIVAYVTKQSIGVDHMAHIAGHSLSVNGVDHATDGYGLWYHDPLRQLAILQEASCKPLDNVECFFI